MAVEQDDVGPFGAERPDLIEIDLPLPPSLRRFGASTRVSLTGPDKAPVLVLLGGISANRHACIRADGEPGWWAGLVAPGAAADRERFRILGFEFIADESGEVAPTPFDQAEILALALDHFGIEKAHALIGASYGGMIALSFAQTRPERVGKLVVISADASPHPSATAMRELQRRVVDLGRANGCCDDALAIARGIGMMTYRTPTEFAARFDGGIDGESPLTASEPGDYLRSRGEAFLSVMSAGRYLSLSASIDRHRVAAETIRTPTLLIGALSDQLVPPEQMQALATRLATPARLTLLDSFYGHDMFLKDVEPVGALIGPFLRD